MTDGTTNDGSVYGSSHYFATLPAPPPAHPSLGADLDVDVCVIGGGLAGLTTAREVALRGWSVALLEAKRLAWNASGRNTGFVLPGFAQAPDKIIDRVGEERARELWRLAQGGVDYVRNTIRQIKMPGVAPIKGWLFVSKSDRAEMMARDAEQLRTLFEAEVEYWPTEQVRAQLKSTHYFQAVHFPNAFHIHPLNYALGLAQAAVEAGVRIFEHTPAVSIDPAGVRKRVVTPDARVRANHIVLAGNVHIGGLLPKLVNTLLPVTTYVAATAPLGRKLSDAIAFRGAVSDTEWADNHYRVTGDHRILWSGRCTTWPREPQRYAKTLQADILRRYPQLGEVKIERIWNGTLGNSVHLMPQIGEWSPGVWLASGFGGHGLNTTAMAGDLLARAIVNGDRTWQAFLPFELIWAGGILGRAAAQLAYWQFRARENFEGWRSRRREQATAPLATPIAVQESAPKVVAESGTLSAESLSPSPNVGEHEGAPKGRRKRKSAAVVEPLLQKSPRPNPAE